MPDRYEVIIARHGTYTSRKSLAYYNFEVYSEPDGPVVTDYYLWVIRNAHSTVLVDTGFDRTSAQRRGRTILHTPSRLYRALGVDVDAPMNIVLTHAHWDHIGNLDLFPNATFWIAAAEYEFWQQRASKAEVMAHFTERRELDQLIELAADGRLRLFGQNTTIAPGIEVIPTGGHTPGQSMVTADTAEGVVLLTSDAVHFKDELVRRRPFMAVADVPAMLDAFDIVNSMAGEDGSVEHVVTGHDPTELVDRYRLHDDIAIIGRLESVCPQMISI